ncbi:MAG: hypothetical protein RJA49_1275, partial [Actinomycetota bacterium]
IMSSSVLAPAATLDVAAQELLFRDAHTAHAFTDQPVTDAEVAAIYDLVKWAPTSMNTQPLRLVLVRSSAARERLLTHMAEGNRAKTAQAPLVAVLAADVDFHEQLHKVVPNLPGAKDRFPDAAAREEFARGQAWLQAGYTILGIRALGLDVGPMTGFDAAGLDADLLAGTALKSIVVVNIGHPGPGAHRPRNPRLEQADVVITL